jgi:RimJ/RimL family protein N-acetyltransferase
MREARCGRPDAGSPTYARRMSPMREIRLRPLRESDLDALAANYSPDADEWNYFGARAANSLRNQFAKNGCLSDESGEPAVESPDGTLLGSVGWHEVRYGPTRACIALNMGISLLREHRNQGFGSAAQRAFADYTFSTRLVERIEASTDVENVAEQKALERAGFTREGILRHAQFRAGSWHDMVIFSRLRGDAG